MAISFRSATTATSGLNSLPLNVPTGTVDGDLLIAAVGTFDLNNTISTPVGLTKMASGAQPFWVAGTHDEGALATYYRPASSEPASYTFTTPGAGDDMVGVMLSLPGAAITGTIIDDFADNSDQGAIQLVTFSPVSANVGGMLIAIAGWYDGGASSSISTPPTGYTSRGTAVTADVGIQVFTAPVAATAAYSASCNLDDALGHGTRMLAVRSLAQATGAAELRVSLGIEQQVTKRLGIEQQLDKSLSIEQQLAFRLERD